MKVKSESDYDLAIEASIVRIMKKNKEMKVSDLVVQVQMESPQFQTNICQIKSLIEKLIKLEYIERDT